MINVVFYINSPRFVKTDLANSYYSEVVEFIEQLGATVKTEQRATSEVGLSNIGDIYISHGSQAERLDYIEQDHPGSLTLRLGHPAGVCHPIDSAWQQRGSQGVPPNEHYVFTADQKLAIEAKLAEAAEVDVPVVAVESRQSSSRRPSVR